jgi:hypothetical protein
LTADAQNVELEGRFDAVLMFGAPDIYASPRVIANLVPHLRKDARFVAFGAKLAGRPWAKVINAVFRFLFSKATFVSTPQLDFEPWKRLEQDAVSFAHEEYFFGWLFLAWGIIASADT